MGDIPRRCKENARGEIIMTNIFLIGFMGCGKSTVADCLLREYDMKVVEMDQELVERVGMTIPEIFSKYGEEYFRDEETKLLTECQKKSHMVVSCGGGVVLREKNVEIMKSCGIVVWLTAKPSTILERIGNDENRPLLEGNKNISAIQLMLEKRLPCYEKAADLVVETDGRDTLDICREILKKVRGEGVC